MTQSPEFSRTISVEGITPDKTRHETIEATEEECAALASRFGLKSVAMLKARLDIRRVAGGEVIRVGGSYAADIVQSCVVSLQDVPAHLEGQFETYFTEDAAKAAPEDDFSFDPAISDEDAPEMVAGGMIDLGEVTAQYLSLDIDPYPRAPGVSLAAQMVEAGGGGKTSPFQVLEGLKDKENK